MKKVLFLAVALVGGFAFSTTAHAQQAKAPTIIVDGQSFADLNRNGTLETYEDTRLPDYVRAEDLLSRLNIDEKISLTVGTGMAGFEMLAGFDAVNPLKDAAKYLVPGSAGSTTPILRLGLPAVVMSDGPAGVRISPTRKNSTNTYYATGFPVGTLLASTWDVDLVRSVGEAMGNEALEYGIDILLAPALNIMRNPLSGRNFEYYSEDPVIAGKMAAAATLGVQSNGVGVSLKHFAVNNSEKNRMKVDAHLSQRALREIYLRGFEIAVKEANPYTIMSSYNKVGGIYTSANYDLLTTILRDEWGFKGLVMTDWFGGYSNVSNLVTNTMKGIQFEEHFTVDQLKAGNDLMMPGVIPQLDDLKAGLANGTLTEDDLDIAVRRVLKMMFNSPTMKGYNYSDKPDLKAHAELTRTAATEGMVLLENRQSALPFTADVNNIAVFGTYSYNFVPGGTGSGNVNRAYTVSLMEGLTNAGYTTDASLDKIYTPFSKKEQDKIDAIVAKAPLSVLPILSQPKLKKSVIDKTVKNNDVAVITIGRSSGEDKDREIEGEFNLTADEHALIDQVSAAYHAAGKKVIVVINTGGVIETASWKNKVDAVLLAWLPGQEGGNSVADVLAGKANPSGRLTMTFPVKYEDTPCHDTYNGIPAEDPTDIEYKDGIYVGYRYFTSFNVPTSYEFGYGLSYTDFAYSNLKLSSNTFGTEMFVTVDVKNTGSVAGKEVAQLYLSAPAGAVDKPVKELKAFAKTRELKPGETQTLYFRLTPHDLASFNEQNHTWVADKGQYKVEIGASVLKAKQTASFTLPETIAVEKVNNVMNNDWNFTDMKR